MTEDEEWSPKKAARQALDMRAKTARYMGSEENITRLLDELQLRYLGLMRSGEFGLDAAIEVIYSGFGYKPDRSDSGDRMSLRDPAEYVNRMLRALAERIANDEAEQLASAELYIVSPEMWDVVVAAAATLSDEDVRLCTPEDLPSPNGLVVFPTSVVSDRGNGELGDVRAVRWSNPARLKAFSPERRKRLSFIGMKLSPYLDVKPPYPIPERDAARKQAAAERKPLPPLLFGGARIGNMSEDPHLFNRLASTIERNDEEARRLKEEFRTEAAEEDADTSREVLYEPGATVPDPGRTLDFRLLYAMWRLCGQKKPIAERKPFSLGRETGSRLPRPGDAGSADEVQLIRLRKRERASEAREPDPSRFRSAREQRYRIMVRMHKVNQWFPKQRCHKILFRGPFPRGAEHLPFAPPKERVSVLVR